MFKSALLFIILFQCVDAQAQSMPQFVPYGMGMYNPSILSPAELGERARNLANGAERERNASMDAANRGDEAGQIDHYEKSKGNQESAQRYTDQLLQADAK